MLKTIIFLAIIGLIVTGILVRPFFVKSRRNRLKNLRISPLWQAIITEKIPIYDCLSPDERKRLRGHLQVFLAEKQFIGCRGLQITEEIKITIAAIACLLLLNERGSYFSQLRSILVYPSTYLVHEKSYKGNYVVEENSSARLGESWTNDQVVLSWEQIQQDTHNLIICPRFS